MMQIRRAWILYRSVHRQAWRRCKPGDRRVCGSPDPAGSTGWPWSRRRCGRRVRRHLIGRTLCDFWPCAVAYLHAQVALKTAVLIRRMRVLALALSAW